MNVNVNNANAKRYTHARLVSKLTDSDDGGI